MNIIWVLAVAVVLAGLQMLVYRLWGMKNITYRRYFTKTAVHQGEKLQMVEVLGNMKLLPMPWIRLEARMSPNLRFGRQADLDISGDLYHHSVFAMGPYQRITRKHDITCLKRGAYRMDSVALSCGDVFGFINTSQTRDLGLEVLVYPPIGDIHTLQVPSRRWQGETVVRRYIQSDPFLVNGIREYRPGDALRDVHWGATARMQQIMVKTHDYTANPKLYLLLNVQYREDQWDEISEKQEAPVEELIALAATYALWARDNGVDTAFACNARLSKLDESAITVPFGGGEGHYQQMMAAMARMRLLRRRSFTAFLDEEILPSGITGADIVILSLYWSPRLEEYAQRLRAMGNSVTWQGGKEAGHEV